MSTGAFTKPQEKSSELHSIPCQAFSLPNISLKCTIFLLTASFFFTLLLTLQLNHIQSPLHFSWPLMTTKLPDRDLTSMLRDPVTFLPLKDLSPGKQPTGVNSWFMSSINETFEPNDSGYLYFPSKSSKGQLLCLSAHDELDGAKNSYAFAWHKALPHGAMLLPGLTYISETYYDYFNLWHALNAVAPFVGWNMRKGCVPPTRWILFHWGELRTAMVPWIKAVADATIGKAEIETFSGIEGPACFEQAVVFRDNQGNMSTTRIREVYAQIRCKVREYCKVEMQKIRNRKDIQMTLLLRTGSRSFKNESVVVNVFKEECRKAGNCMIKVKKSDQLSFCEQVMLASETDILVSPHGAQMTNMIFLETNSNLMEFFPKGWEELAGIGRLVFSWVADWVGMRHQGYWYDKEGPSCPNPSDELGCFDLYKDGQIGHDMDYFSQWASRVLQEVKEQKKSIAAQLVDTSTDACQCR